MMRMNGKMLMVANIGTIALAARDETPPAEPQPDPRIGNTYNLPGKPMPFELFEIELSPVRYDHHGDLLEKGGKEIGVFRRFTSSGKPKWQRVEMTQAQPV